MNIFGLTRQHKIAWKSGRKFILKFSPQAGFNFVQPWVAVAIKKADMIFMQSAIVIVTATTTPSLLKHLIIIKT